MYEAEIERWNQPFTGTPLNGQVDTEVCSSSATSIEFDS
jgi:hypothetical protein